MDDPAIGGIHATIRAAGESSTIEMFLGGPEAAEYITIIPSKYIVSLYNIIFLLVCHRCTIIIIHTFTDGTSIFAMSTVV